MHSFVYHFNGPDGKGGANFNDLMYREHVNLS